MGRMGKPRDDGYEYRQVKVPNRAGKAQERAINKVAAEGWELVQIRAGGGWTKDTATFKRPRAR